MREKSHGERTQQLTTDRSVARLDVAPYLSGPAGCIANPVGVERQSNAERGGDTTCDDLLLVPQSLRVTGIEDDDVGLVRLRGILGLGQDVLAGRTLVAARQPFLEQFGPGGLAAVPCPLRVFECGCMQT